MAVMNNLLLLISGWLIVPDLVMMLLFVVLDQWRV